MRNQKSKARIAILSAVVLGVSSTATVAPSFAADRLAQGTQAQGDFSDEQLQAYARAAMQVQQINMAMEQATQNTSDPDQMRNVQQQAYADLERAIKSNGLTVEEYNAIGQKAQTDKQTRDTVTEYFQQMQQQGNQPAPTPPAQ